MGKKLSSVVGIDIGNSTIKVVELRSKGREAELVSIGIVDTPEGAVDYTGVYNSDEVGNALKALLKSSQVKTQPAVISLAGQASVLVRTLEVPRMTPAELKEHMQWEINRNIPFAESTVLSDYQVLPDEDPSSANMEVVMAIAPESAIDTLVSCAKRAGKQVVGIDVEPLALARSLEFSHGDEYRDQVICIVEMGAKTTAINIYKNGKLLMPRQIPIGGEMFTKAIADADMIGLPDAEQKKRSHGTIPASAVSAAQQGGFVPSFGAGDAGATQEFSAYNPFADQPLPPNPFMEPDSGTSFNPFADAPPAAPVAPEPAPPLPGTDAPPAAAIVAEDGDPEAARLYNSMRPVLEEFVAEVRRSVDYFRSRGGEVNRILLAGGGTKLGGLDAYIHASLGLECSRYDAIRNLKWNDKRVPTGLLEENQSEFTVVIGTALHILFD